MVECSTVTRFIHLIGNINIWKVPKCWLNLTCDTNNSEKNVWMFVCGCQQIDSQHELN